MRRSVIGLGVLFALEVLTQPELFAQIPTSRYDPSGFPLPTPPPPTVTEVRNLRNNAAGLAPGVLAEVRYTPTNLSFNLPTDVAALVGGRRGGVLADAQGRPGVIDVYLPEELTPGPTTLVLTIRGASSAPFNLLLDPYAPGLAGIGRLGGFPNQFSCSPAGTATPGDIVTAFAYGLGATTPQASTVGRPSITVGGQPVEVLESVRAGADGHVGDYWVTFVTPPTDGWLPVVLTIGGKSSNPVRLPVGRTVLHVSSAAWKEGPAAPESIVTAVSCAGRGFFAPGFVGDGRNPPTTLGGTTVKVKDATGVERPAPLIYVDRYQVNYVIPPGTANGYATVTVTSGDGIVSTGTPEIQTVAPGVFKYAEFPAAQVVRVRNGAQTVEPVSRLDPGGPWIIVWSPIDMGPDTDQVYLAVFGTGLRFRSSLANLRAKIGGADIPVEYAGPQSEFAGLDQVNLRLPRSLAGRGAVTLELTVDGKAANVTYLAFK